MNKSQQALAIARQKEGGQPLPDYNVSGSLVRKAEQVLRSKEALVLCQAIEQGEMTVNHAYEHLQMVG